MTIFADLFFRTYFCTLITSHRWNGRRPQSSVSEKYHWISLEFIW